MKKTIVPFFSALICLLFLFACAPKQVENKEVEVVFNGSKRECLYTGEYLYKPVGVGEYKFSYDGDEWVFIGEASEESEITTGIVDNMPLVIKHDGEKFETFYSGEIVDSMPVGPVQITDFPYTLKYEDEELEGLYTGSILDNAPDGTGEFTYENKGDYFEYSGGWKAGAMSGDGTLESNFLTVHLPYADRLGEYKGDVIDGVPCGQGTFTAKNDEGVAYTYKGGWANGVFEGIGHCEFLNDDYWIHDGNFSKGEFRPSIADFFVSSGSAKNSRFSISDKEYDFIGSHASMFTGRMQEIDDQFIDKGFKYEEFSKNSSAFELSIIKVNGLRVIQVFEYDVYGYKYVFVLAEDSRYRPYYINMIGSAPNIVEGSRIQFVGMPVDYFTYKSVSGTDIWAIACVGISVTKQ